MTKQSISVPCYKIGPVVIRGSEINESLEIPLATFESPLWPSTNRGAKITRLCGGVSCTLFDERMTRSVALQAANAATVKEILTDLKRRNDEIRSKIKKTSRHCEFDCCHHQVVGNLLYLRLEATTGEASGHNMLTKAAEALIRWLLAQYPSLKYISISGNVCVDKKVSAINGILGRGKYVIADMTIPKTICEQHLKTSPEAIHNINIKKNLMGSIVSGSIRTANAHFANLLYAIYLATGQDVANIVEGSQGMVHTELRQGDLYFSATIPNIIVGTVGNGKHHDDVRKNLIALGCTGDNSARRLAIIVAATVFCGELSLLAAQTNLGELMSAHEKFERSIQVKQG